MRGESERTGTEITTDKALFLALIWQVEQTRQRVDDLLKAQKLAFLATWSLFRDREKAFSLEFFRYEHGPMSKAIYGMLDEFTDLGLLRRKGSSISSLSKGGAELAAQFSAEVLDNPVNAFCTDRMKETAGTYGSRSGLRLRSMVYGLECKTLESSKTRKVLEIPAFEHFTKALDPEEAKHSLVIPDDWLGTIDLMLSAEKTASIERALKSKFVDERDLKKCL